MKIVIACDSFKGSLTSLEAGNAAAEGVREALPECEVMVLPVADGGEGTTEAITLANNGKMITAEVTGPMGDKVRASYGICGDTAVIEMAAASGLTLVTTENRNPLRATTFGTGELIADSIRRGCRTFLIGIGGSATNDGGIGMLRALGFRFLDNKGKEIGNNVSDFLNLASIDPSNVIPELKDCRFTAACDVSTPLTGPEGASYIFGPQKGATPEMLPILDNALLHFAKISGKENFSSTPGSGAGGGMGFALMAFLNATLKPGIEMVLDAIGFDQKIEGASRIITGEGKLDSQTCLGKAPAGVLRRAQRQGIPVIAIGGSVDTAALPSLKAAGFSDILAVTPPGQPLAEAMTPAIAKGNICKTITYCLTASNEF